MTGEHPKGPPSEYPTSFLIMDKDRNRMAQHILDLTLEIIFLLTGSDRLVVGKCSEWFAHHRSPDVEKEFCSSPIMNVRDNEQKILELTSRIIQLLTGEVPVRCDDVTVYFSMEEWAFIEVHRELYKDAMMEDHQPHSSLDQPMEKAQYTDGPQSSVCKGEQTTPEGENVPASTQDHVTVCKEENPDGGRNSPQPVNSSNVQEEHPGVTGTALCDYRHLTDAGAEDTRGEDTSAQVKEEPTQNPTGSVEFTERIKHSEECGAMESDSQGPANQCGVSEGSEGNAHKESPPLPEVVKTPAAEGAYSCAECRKRFQTKFDLIKHQTGGERCRWTCVTCGKTCPSRSSLVKHYSVHTGRFSCSVCGRRYRLRSSVAKHEETHKAELPFPCLGCDQRFAHRADLDVHARTHSGEKPPTCSERWKCFDAKLSLASRRRRHAGEEPLECSDCGKCFSDRSNLAQHTRTHTGEEHLPSSE